VTRLRRMMLEDSSAATMIFPLPVRSERITSEVGRPDSLPKNVRPRAWINDGHSSCTQRMFDWLVMSVTDEGSL